MANMLSLSRPDIALMPLQAALLSWVQCKQMPRGMVGTLLRAQHDKDLGTRPLAGRVVGRLLLWVGLLPPVHRFVTKELIARGFNVTAFAREKAGIKGKMSREDTAKVHGGEKDNLGGQQPGGQQQAAAAGTRGQQQGGTTRG